MRDFLSAQWSVIALGLMAVTYNFYSMDARKNKYVMGKTFWQYKAFFEVLNWALFAASVVYLSYRSSWWALLSAILFAATGKALSIMLKGVTQILYLFGMPVFIIFVLWRLTH